MIKGMASLAPTRQVSCLRIHERTDMQRPPCRYVSCSPGRCKVLCCAVMEGAWWGRRSGKGSCSQQSILSTLNNLVINRRHPRPSVEYKTSLSQRSSETEHHGDIAYHHSPTVWHGGMVSVDACTRHGSWALAQEACCVVVVAAWWACSGSRGDGGPSPAMRGASIHISIRRSSKPIVPILSTMSKISVLPKLSVMSIVCL